MISNHAPMTVETLDEEGEAEITTFDEGKKNRIVVDLQRLLLWLVRTAALAKAKPAASNQAGRFCWLSMTLLGVWRAAL